MMIVLLSQSLASTLSLAAKNNDAATTCVALGCLAIVVIIYLIESASSKRERRRKMEAEAEASYKRWRQAAESSGSLPTCDAPHTTAPDEVCYYSAGNVRLCEPRAVRNGQYHGVSVPIVSGLRIHSGGYRSTSHNEWRAIEIGTLSITSKQLSFLGEGGMTLKFIPQSKIEFYHAAPTQLLIQIKGRQRPMLFEGVNGQMARDIIEAIHSAP